MLQAFIYHDRSEPLSCPYLILRCFVALNDFARLYEVWERENFISSAPKRDRKGKRCLGEMVFIMVLFHLSAYKDFKHFWLYGIEREYRSYFGELPSYGRFVALMPRLFMPLCLLLHSLRGEQTGIYFIDSTKLAVCHNARSSRNRVFAGMAKRGKTSVEWFYGFKLHLIINHKGEIRAVHITPGNCDDRAPVQSMVKKLQGKLFDDRGYISEKLFQTLWAKSVQLITGIRKNMKNHLMPFLD